MDKVPYKEVLENLNTIERSNMLHGKEIYLFGHSNIKEILVDLLYDRGYSIVESLTIIHPNKWRTLKVLKFFCI